MLRKVPSSVSGAQQVISKYLFCFFLIPRQSLNIHGAPSLVGSVLDVGIQT